MLKISRGAVLVCAIAIALPVMASPSLAVAQEVSAEKPRGFEIPAGPLGAALNKFASESGLSLVYSAELARGRNTAGLSGSYTRKLALTQLLAGTNLIFRFTDPNTVVIEPGSADRRVLDPVRVEGAVAGANAANGSTDVTATEGTGSYTTHARTIGSKAPVSIEDTVQAVSVITQQQMRDQNLNDFAAVLDQATGISRVAERSGTSSNMENSFYSRGFQVVRIQVDGGAPLDMGGNSSYFPTLDMAQYDHVEVLRGVDGLYNGNGNPGGAINLVRKRPLDRAHVAVETVLDSWGSRRAVLDAGAPLGFDGKLRGRAVLTLDQKKFFYDTSKDDHTLFYGIAEYDVSDATRVGIGASINSQDAVPWYNGLPRYTDGSRFGDRELCLCVPWATWDMDTTELFAQVDRRLPADWSARLKFTRVNQEGSRKYFFVSRPPNRINGNGAIMNGTLEDSNSRQNVIDLSTNGEFELFGSTQRLTLGAHHQMLESGGTSRYGFLYGNNGAAINLNHFDPANYPEPASVPMRDGYPVRDFEQSGVYANLTFTLFDRLHIPFGMRWTQYEVDSVMQSVTPSGVVYSSLAAKYRGSDFTKQPDLSVAYDFSPDWTGYASYMSIYRLQLNSLQKNGEPVGPVTGTNMELGVKARLRDGKLTASLNAYRLEQMNFAVRDNSVPFSTAPGSVSCCYLNRGKEYIYLSQGADFEVAGEVLPDLQLSFGYTYNKNEYHGSAMGGLAGEPLVSRLPEHLLKFWSNWKPRGGLLNGFEFGLGVTGQTGGYYAGNVCVESTTNASGTVVCTRSTPYEFSEGGYAVFSGRVGYQVTDHWHAALNIENLADRTYLQTVGDTVTGNWYGEPRSFTFSVRGSF